MKRTFPVYILVMIGALFVTGCGYNGNEYTDPPPNRPPIIDRVIVPDEVKAGEKVKLEVVAHDPEDDELCYSWEVRPAEGHENRTMNLDREWDAVSDGEWTVPAITWRLEVSVRVQVVDPWHTNVWSSPTIVKIIPLPPPPPPPLPPRPPPPPPHELIVPGVKAAGISLGDTLNRVKAIYGEPADFHGVLHDTWYFWDVGLSVLLSGGPRGKIIMIAIDPPSKARTVGGVGIGSPRRAVERDFGQANHIRVFSYWYWEKGIKFEMQSHKVNDIIIFEPR